MRTRYASEDADDERGLEAFAQTDQVVAEHGAERLREIRSGGSRGEGAQCRRPCAESSRHLDSGGAGVAARHRRERDADARSGRPAVPPADEQPRRQPAQGLGEGRSRAAVAPLDRERRRLRGARPGIDAGEVDRDPPGHRLAQLGEEVRGPVAGRRTRRGPRARHASAAGGAGSPASRRRPAASPSRRPGAASARQALAARPARRLVEQRVLVEVRVRRPAASAGEPSPNTARIDGANTSPRSRSIARTVRWKVHLLVHEQARGQEHLEGADARLVERQPAVRDERVAAQPLDVDRARPPPR